MSVRRWWTLATVVALSLTVAGCEKLGLNPSGRLACSRTPPGLCPGGFYCSAGLCWQNGTVPSLAQASDGAAPLDAASADALEETAAVDVRTTADAAATAEPAIDARDDAALDAGHADAPCDGPPCGASCEAGFRRCPGTSRCIRAAAPACCADAECPPTAPTCLNGQCKPRSNNDPCASDAECGSGHCAPTSSGSASKVCCDSACSGSCNAGCAGGTCQFKPFRTTCGEIDEGPYTPRYFICDGDGNCNPPSFNCNGFGNVCAASQDAICCADPNDSYMLGCVTLATCASQNVGDYEMSCAASIDCPAGTFCCSEQNSNVLVTGCAGNCQTFATQGRDPVQYTHNQLCDLMRDPSCPMGKRCQIDQLTGLGMCGL